MAAYVELRYRRNADGRGVNLVAELPTVRAIDVGGAPDGLRLPDADPQAAAFRLSPAGDAYLIEKLGEERVAVNNAALTAEPRWLADGDVIRVGPFELTFRDGEIREDERLLDSQHRWKQRIPDEVRPDGESDLRDDSTPYMREFELSVRPLIASDQHDEVERRANAELLRVIRADEADILDRYCRFLWSIRVAAVSRAGRPKDAEELCQQAIDLFPQDASMLFWLGTAQLRRFDWPAAVQTLTRCLRVATHADLRALHLARVGLALARHEELGATNDRHHRLITPHSNDWDVSLIELHTPGDEMLLWHVTRSIGLFGGEGTTQFRFRGASPDPNDATRIVQRWEVFDRANARLYRTLVRIPTVIHADPSLLVEGAILRQYLTQHDGSWMNGVIDLSDADDSIRKSPVTFEPAVIEILSRRVTKDEPFVRVATARREEGAFTFQVNFIARPAADDVVYRQGALSVAVAERDLELLAGARLSWQSDAEGEGFCLQSPNFTPVKLLRKRRKPQLRPARFRTAYVALLVIVALLLLRLIALVWP